MARSGNNHKGGRPKGSVGTNTLRAREQRKVLQELLGKRLGPMINAQIDAAIGYNVIYEPVYGKNDNIIDWKRVKDAGRIDELLSSGEEFYNIYTKDPSTNAAKALLDKAVGTPKDADAPEEKTPLLVLIKQLNVAKVQQLKGEVTKVIADVGN